MEPLPQSLDTTASFWPAGCDTTRQAGKFPEVEILSMKRTHLLCFLFLASLTWGQSIGPSVVNGQPQPLRLPGNAQHASAAPLAIQHSLLGFSSSSAAKGERPLWEVAPPRAPITPLGDTARALRKQHEVVKKAVIVHEN